MASKKGKNKKREILGLKCVETGIINYTIYKPLNLEPGKSLEVKKFCPKLKRHTMHKMSKIK